MADEETEKKTASYFVQDAEMRTVYANRATAVISSSDISMFFGVEDYKEDREIGRLTTRIVMNHSQFMLLVEYLAARYEMLRTMYDGPPPNLDTVATNDPERAKAAWAILGISPAATQNESDHISQIESKLVDEEEISDKRSAS